MKKNMKRFMFLSLVTALVVGVWASIPTGKLSAGDKVLVCHLEDKDTGDGHIIEVSLSSLDGHIGHGDEPLEEGVVGDPCHVELFW